MKVSGVAWRAMTGYDLPEVEAIAAVAHPDFFEAPEVFAERQRLYHFGAYMLEVNERAVGYVLSHPWWLADPPRLNARIDAIPPDADTYYIHDLALLPMARRIGAASYIVNALVKHAAACGLPVMSLVAVNASQGFWERQGFSPAFRPDLSAKLAGYAEDARLMTRPCP